MKKSCLILFLLCCEFGLNAQIINFPDSHFKSRLLQANVNNAIANYIRIDSNNNGEIEVAEAQNVTYLNLSNASISDLTGLSYFKLSIFNCSNNAITNLNDLDQQYLESLYCSNNQLTELEITSSSLVDIVCFDNLIESIDLSMLNFTDRVDIHNNLINTFIPPQYIVRLDIRNNNFNGFVVPDFAIEAILIFGDNPSNELIFNDTWRNPKELVFSSQSATSVDLSNVPAYSYETDDGQPNFYFFNCDLLESIKLNNNLLSSQSYPYGSITIQNCENLNFICADLGEEIYFNQRLAELGLDSQVEVSTECDLSNPTFESANGIRLFPNPAKNTLNIQVEQEISSITIYNTLGQLVLSIPNAVEISAIDISFLALGTYIIKLISPKATLKGRFIKQ